MLHVAAAYGIFDWAAAVGCTSRPAARAVVWAEIVARTAGYIVLFDLVALGKGEEWVSRGWLAGISFIVADVALGTAVFLVLAADCIG